MSADNLSFKKPTRALHDKRIRKLKRMAPHLANRPVLVTMNYALAMLDDDRFGHAAAQLLATAFASAKGEIGPERQECFACLRPWTMDRAVVLIGCAEVVKKPGKSSGHVLMFGVCGECCSDRPLLSAALERDFGEFKLICQETGTA